VLIRVWKVEKSSASRKATTADELRMVLQELLRKAELEHDADFLREGVRVLSQALMELAVSQHLGAERHERTVDRAGHRNGYRERRWDTRVGSIDLRVPRVRDGSSYPSLLESQDGRAGLRDDAEVDLV
jgi:putative transposase